MNKDIPDKILTVFGLDKDILEGYETTDSIFNFAIQLKNGIPKNIPSAIIISDEPIKACNWIGMEVFSSLLEYNRSGEVPKILTFKILGSAEVPIFANQFDLPKDKKEEKLKLFAFTHLSVVCPEFALGNKLNRNFLLELIQTRAESKLSTCLFTSCPLTDLIGKFSDVGEKLFKIVKRNKWQVIKDV